MKVLLVLMLFGAALIGAIQLGWLGIIIFIVAANLFLWGWQRIKDEERG